MEVVQQPLLPEPVRWEEAITLRSGCQAHKRGTGIVILWLSLASFLTEESEGTPKGEVRPAADGKWVSSVHLSFGGQFRKEKEEGIFPCTLKPESEYRPWL